jgi:hypothetical protein
MTSASRAIAPSLPLTAVNTTLSKVPPPSTTVSNPRAPPSTAPVNPPVAPKTNSSSLSSAPARNSTSLNTTLPTLPALTPETYHLVFCGVVAAVVPSAVSMSEDVLSAVSVD